MATCRFVLTNVAENATVLNGTAGSPTPPVRSELAPFTMERALNPDRRSLWRAGAANDVSAGTDWQLDIDLGSAMAVNVATLHGLSCPGGAITAVGAGYLDSYPSGTYVLIGGMLLNGRDAHMVFSTFTKRYWTFLIQATAAPVVGRVVLGQTVDLALAPNPGSESSPFRNRAEQELEDGSFNINELGSPGHSFALTFDPASASTRIALESLHGVPGSLTYIDPRDRCFEVLLRQGRVGERRIGTAHDGLSIEMARLP